MQFFFQAHLQSQGIKCILIAWSPVIIRLSLCLLSVGCCCWRVLFFFVLKINSHPREANKPCMIYRKFGFIQCISRKDRCNCQGLFRMAHQLFDKLVLFCAVPVCRQPCIVLVEYRHPPLPPSQPSRHRIFSSKLMIQHCWSSGKITVAESFLLQSHWRWQSFPAHQASLWDYLGYTRFIAKFHELCSFKCLK